MSSYQPLNRRARSLEEEPTSVSSRLPQPLVQNTSDTELGSQSGSGTDSEHCSKPTSEKDFENYDRGQESDSESSDEDAPQSVDGRSGSQIRPEPPVQTSQPPPQPVRPTPTASPVTATPAANASMARPTAGFVRLLPEKLEELQPVAFYCDKCHQDIEFRWGDKLRCRHCGDGYAFWKKRTTRLCQFYAR
ncbi:hypothetical protein AOQ84DRAFT_6826 [Glonium stellatum]|uniref:Uncharacterized protein n=1 Tax=Glonium stellatum TaxID=574774 RepID=A0A8E2EMI5_9PEZI|nr:hypothetical protein AOQ84DRAFT_6826 [Glonium stellatum]